MNTKKVFGFVGSLLILGLGFAFSQPQADPSFQDGTPSAFQWRTLFVDEDGDGVCDRARDHDGDGIPNCQDPDWEGPQQDGAGLKNRFGQGGDNGFGNPEAFRGENGLNRNSFRNQYRNGSGGGVGNTQGGNLNGSRGGGR